jgi:membrane protein implicated in regulation of membrane protease activity
VTIVVIFILAAVWAVVLLPPWLRRRREGDPTDSIVSFRRQLSTLGRTAPAWTASGPSASARRALASAERRRRRREVLSRLAVVTGFTLVMAVVLQGLAIALFAVASALLVSYVALLIRAEHQRLERREKVRYLPQPESAEPQLLLRRSASQ